MNISYYSRVFGGTINELSMEYGSFIWFLLAMILKIETKESVSDSVADLNIIEN